MNHHNAVTDQGVNSRPGVQLSVHILFGLSALVALMTGPADWSGNLHCMIVRA
jgi:hypothetical protein